MSRLIFVLPLVLLAACSSDKPADDSLVTLDGAGTTAADGAAPAGAAPGAAQAGVQAVDAEGSKLEPLLSSAIATAGLETGACRFSPAQGALPVLVASRAGGKAIASVAGSQIDFVPSGTVAATGGSFGAQGVTLMVSAAGSQATGNKASMQVTDADGPAFTYQDGFWACN